MGEPSKSDLTKRYSHLSLLQKLHASIRIKRLPFSQFGKIVPKSGRVLDVGCGHGFLSIYLAETSPKRFVTGTDISKSKITVANIVKHSRNVEFLYDPDNKTLNKKNYYNCILLINVLYLMSEGEQKQMIKKASQALKKNGILILTEPNAERFFGVFIERVREYIMVNIMRATEGSSIVYHKKSWWLKELGKHFAKITTHTFMDSTVHLMYTCVK